MVEAMLSYLCIYLVDSLSVAKSVVSRLLTSVLAFLVSRNPSKAQYTSEVKRITIKDKIASKNFTVLPP